MVVSYNKVEQNDNKKQNNVVFRSKIEESNENAKSKLETENDQVVLTKKKQKSRDQRKANRNRLIRISVTAVGVVLLYHFTFPAYAVLFGLAACTLEIISFAIAKKNNSINFKN